MGRALRFIPQELFFLVGWAPEPVLIIFARGLIKADFPNSPHLDFSFVSKSRSPSIPLKAGEEREPSGQAPYSPVSGGVGGLNQRGSKLSYKRHLLSVSILS